jgi:MYXO-CTERM domain-containing protein
MIANRHVVVMVTTVAAVQAASPARAEVVAYWNFNQSNGDLYHWDADVGFGRLTVDPAWTSVGVDVGSELNALLGDPAGNALALRGQVNNGRYVELAFGTLGFEDIVFSFATARNNNGFNDNQLWYSIDGVTFELYGAYSPLTSFDTETFDLAGIAGIDDAEEVTLRIHLAGATSNGGWNRLDNIRIMGTPLPAPGALALLGLVGACCRRRRRTG